MYVIAAAILLTAAATSCKKSVTSITLNETKLTLLEGETKTLTATVLPDEASDKTVNWLSSNSAVAMVTADGLVSAISKGTATITATATDGNKTASCVITVFRTHYAEPELVSVEGGKFTMGCTDGAEDERPTHEVTLSNFSIATKLVTQEQWQSIMGSNPSVHKGVANRPVENVRWSEVQEFISRLNDSTGRQYRLPTEAEWEYAARGGNKSEGYKYSGSNTLDDVAWYGGNSGNTTKPIGTKQPNELGIYDMSGNVWEWCSDWYGTYSASPQTNPKGPATGQYRITRGGAYLDNSFQITTRRPKEPSDRGNNHGFRLAHP